MTLGADIHLNGDSLCLEAVELRRRIWAEHTEGVPPERIKVVASPFSRAMETAELASGLPREHKHFQVVLLRCGCTCCIHQSCLRGTRVHYL